jgi:hypothetical protein
MKRPQINITTTERAGRVAVGAGTAITGLVLLSSAHGALAVVLNRPGFLGGGFY